MQGNGGLLGFADYAAALAYFVFAIGGLSGLIIPPIRRVCGVAVYIASFGIGLDLWLWCVITVHRIWGTVAVVIGLFFAGIGVAPMAIVATLLHKDWVVLGYILINLVLLYACRVAGAALISSADRRRAEMSA